MTLKVGTRVLVRPTPPGLAGSYPAAAWLTEDRTVVLAEDAPNRGTLDVVEVRVEGSADTESIYDFNIVRESSEGGHRRRRA